MSDHISCLANIMKYSSEVLKYLTIFDNNDILMLVCLFLLPGTCMRSPVGLTVLRCSGANQFDSGNSLTCIILKYNNRVSFKVTIKENLI
jgi:hypothetical protein